MEELELKLTAADVALKERELEHAKTTTDKDQAIASGKKGKEEMEVKVRQSLLGGWHIRVVVFSRGRKKNESFF